ncbi:Antibiotic biosynthesis monooxygenase [Arcobacter nitrofigilis DSM 7299]|uniref:Antibiotic biosynthesis monooxygenase n=1 Tax=Arcobacter nitrofigilis (strain ATCC 33309 / DSM 7299 / CCUG 15893 / LMG 7604 / NCTC 12251 / CI) TaxID=572480 RepID=D5UZM3_ARCNC|nr:putative quinol monooxygenase [Arcobacter nitrofigilis]ADG93242.1 Antibiotic biosynthesis monooxygenase [Arcobacter nitrofigilis DSM 7299]
MKNIVIVANVKVKDEFKDEVYNELLKLHKATHKHDEGCIQYDLHKNLEDENSFTFVETWQNAKLLDEHMKKEHFLKFAQFVDGKLESMDIQKLEKVEA